MDRGTQRGTLERIRRLAFDRVPAGRTVTRTLLVTAGVHTVDPQGPRGARSVLLDGDRIAWVGADPAGAPPHDATADLGSAWITPAFVDAHVHGTATGLARTGLDLTTASSAADLLDRVRRFSADAGDVVMGYGWDDFGWPEPRRPTAAQITAAAGGRTVLLSRIDSHSCLVSDRVLDRLPLEGLDGVERDPAGAPTGWLREASSQAAMGVVRAHLPPEALAAARQAACDAALQLGIASLHEMGVPGMFGLDDALAWLRGEWPIEVLTWWAEIDIQTTQRHGLRSGGDLFLDGSIGSCTAATTQPYGTPPGHGDLFHADEEVAEWFTRCTAEGVGLGVHAIGDRAIEQALQAVEVAAAVHGTAAVRACRHRIEHVELPTRDQVDRMGRMGVVASVQPAFDATWGGDAGLYAERFGAQAALRSNPLRWFADAGVVMAFGSDSTVTPLDPTGGLRAATSHLGGLSVDPDVALAAHTVGCRYVAGQDDVGRCAAGHRADLAVWSQDPLRLGADGDVACLATIVRGQSTWGEILRQ
ncbi:MAG: amidohydrolase family protein [Nitriliruptorales bacterium]|nr:amidohydrolase family protein [Nitriliruptorales bacterium]